ncbi:MAG: polyribonucleotide nucleotidyltransferase [Candidatus Magasanikbacteria bacterium CG10_big_fil_rev_8_21_14_0_10_47_10]|uniref:Polyribonucleotide nucleotidyltransferase n=1 Tax=Candidatus Magasanikbacteria bacterium CG10_big_fil_rev_8_21_14_0_10_47_10 TaxID=1974652 RepID=A0A2H0TP67_9BACT|nr:MAG: polyribonucleotide nucleotidyltransferase [Candidatus Magasanikbacteria bacterium CG10_big_fil_rev_8_21_14_0_10_47_10]
MLDIKKWSTTWGGRELELETGRYALQSDMAVTVRYGDTVIMATVVKSDSIREGIDYFPLLVSFEEKLYAAGKIKGSRFIKREGRPSDESILTGRIVDRSIRPLFDERIRNDIQVVLTALSVDGENDAAITSLIAASAALTLSRIPWAGPIAGARIGRTPDGEFILNVTRKELDENRDLDLIVAGTPDALVMTEAAAYEVPETVIFDAMKWGCAQLQPVVDLIEQARKEVGVPKDAVPLLANDDPSVDDSVEDHVRTAVREYVAGVAESHIFDSIKVNRKERYAMIDAIKAGAKKMLTEKGFDEGVHKVGLSEIKLYVSMEISKRILEKKQRLDGRSLTDIRELIVDVDLLPRVHGSAMFMRGDTQALSIVTLGAPGDVQTLDSMEEDGTKRYMHHYNDAPYTYGEVQPMRGPSRRAIGHGALAERALEPVLPPEEEFPYAIRVVSEIMGSNGSSSMASTCGSSLSLMAAGVPLKKPVAGIAMGLASDDKGNWHVLTDLQDVEDGPGGMDFKITGTSDGITAVQMDTKTFGLTWDIVEQTLSQAQDARMRILAVMNEKITEPRAELSPYAPRIETVIIDPEKIGDIIGPGGKIIKKITEETGATIDIEQDGRVMITTNDSEAMKKAREWIEMLTKEVQAGEEYEGKVVRLEDFGAFVQILPNKDGLVHVSEIAWSHVNKPGDVLNMGDIVKVKVKEIDNLGRVNLSMKALLPKPEGYVEAPRPPRTGGGGFRGGDRGGDRRGGFSKRRP